MALSFVVDKIIVPVGGPGLDGCEAGSRRAVDREGVRVTLTSIGDFGGSVPELAEVLQAHGFCGA